MEYGSTLLEARVLVDFLYAWTVRADWLVVMFHVVAIVDPSLRLSPGERVPDGVGAWVQRFDTEKEAASWILDPARETYSTEEGECALVIARDGVVA